jgi:hypothetical protein
VLRERAGSVARHSQGASTTVSMTKGVRLDTSNLMVDRPGDGADRGRLSDAGAAHLAGARP